MPIFEYKGFDSKGQKVNSVIDAENEKAARAKLRRTFIFPTEIRLEGGSKSSGGGFRLFKKVKVSELAYMTRQLATLIDARIPLVEALAALQEQIENPLLKKSLSQIKDRVSEGRRLADAMKGFPEIYNTLYVSMVAAGEASGALETVLNRLADFTEYQAKLKGKITGAMTYPIIMAFVATSLMSYLMISVVPSIVGIFEDAKVALPLPTQIVIFVSYVMQHYWLLLLAFMGLVFFLFTRYAKTKEGHKKVDAAKLKAPVFGVLFRKIAISRFSRTLATLLRSGVQLLGSLDIVKNVVSNDILAEAIETTKNSLKEGESIVGPLRKSGQFPPMVLHMIAVGEKTGTLETMLEKIAINYDTEVDATVSSLTSIMEPTMIIVMGATVAFIVLSIMLPILKMSSLN